MNTPEQKENWSTSIKGTKRLPSRFGGRVAVTTNKLLSREDKRREAIAYKKTYHNGQESSYYFNRRMAQKGII